MESESYTITIQNSTHHNSNSISNDSDCRCLEFKQHISHICHKAYCSINVIVRCFHTANIAALITCYKSFVRPMLEYCSTVWNPYIPARHYLGMTDHCDQVEKVQRYFTRLVYQRCQLDCNHSYLQRLTYICVQLRSWVQKVLHIPIKIKVVVFYFKLYKYIV